MVDALLGESETLSSVAVTYLMQIHFSSNLYVCLRQAKEVTLYFVFRSHPVIGANLVDRRPSGAGVTLRSLGNRAFNVYALLIIRLEDAI